MDTRNPYQPDHLDPRQRRRSLIVIASAGLGSILAFVVLSLVVRPSRSSPTETELAPATPPIETNTTTSVSAVPVSSASSSSAPATTAAPTFVATLPPLSITPPSSPPPGLPVSPPLEWIPPDTPDFDVQCLPDACPDNDPISGWFYIVDGQVSGESQRVPIDKAPQESFYCAV
ncbi:MAG TPA: hypothetical protein VM282_17435 [Acidimicrobiales bacterium]|nr:hypothetical protein [Acidimicrobiales bacterium]